MAEQRRKRGSQNSDYPVVSFRWPHSLLAGLLDLAGCVSDTQAVGTYCCQRPGEQDCLTLHPSGTYTQVYQVHDSAFTTTGTWQLKAYGGELILRAYHARSLDAFKPYGNGVTDTTMPFDAHTFDMADDFPEYTYHRQ